jgi:hypothetical protein
MTVNRLSTEKGSASHLFGRRWKVSILFPDTEATVPPNSDEENYTALVLSDSDREDKSLRVTFNIQRFGWVVPNFSEICIYNIGPALEGWVIKSGMRVMVEAGYVGSTRSFGVIYNAPIFQPLWEREDYVTFKLTLRCVDAMDIIYKNHVKTVGSVLSNQKTAIQQMASEARVSFQIKSMSDNLENNTLARPKVFFGKPIWYLRRYAQQSGSTVSAIDENVYLERAQDPIPIDATSVPLELSPGEGGLIGAPQQTQNGITFTSLLNPQIDVFRPKPMLIKLKNKYIRQAALTPPAEQFSILDPQGIYKILGVTHVGDTRGQDWYSHVVAIDQSMAGALGELFNTQNDVATG